MAFVAKILSASTLKIYDCTSFLFQVSYEMTFYATKSFEIGVRWFMANSQTVAETMRHWCSKAANLSFHMFPVPEDPFGLAVNSISPPLQCPVVIPFRPATVQSHNVRKKIFFDILNLENFC